ncbi:unnamed protein product [Acanthosepion pharaonis]|uniref:Uncharacterized protein n=1 Tax=Acanthosepion pharaonis TaxID=158019 RepID=A0A812D2B0_ACAPH|nr:unnamed protein product [Sepia pharaonis]
MIFIFLSHIIFLAMLQPDFHTVAAGISHLNAEANPMTSTIQSLDVRNSQNKASLMGVHQIQSLLGRQTKKSVFSDKTQSNSPQILPLLKNRQSLTNLGGKRNPPTNAAAQSWGKNHSYLNRKPAGPVGAETSPTAKTALRFQRTLPFVNSNNVINRGFNFYPALMDMDCNTFDIPQMCSSSQDCMSPGYCFQGLQGTSGICCFPGYMD